MTPISYDAIAPNIASVAVEGTQVHVSWQCPVTRRALGTSSGTMSADASVTARVGANVQRTIASEVIYGAARLISGLLGGVAGRVVSNAAYTAAADINAKTTSGVDYTEASRQAAIVSAFDSVKSSFAWDEVRKQFVAR